MVIFVLIVVMEPLTAIGGTVYLRLTGEKTTGIITSYNVTEGRNKGGIYYTYAPVVSFKINNEEVSAIANLNSAKKQFNNIGDNVVIYYDKNNPERIMINNIFSAYIDKLIGILIPMAMFIFPIRILSLMSIKKSDGENYLTTEVPIKNKIIALILGAIPAIASGLWIFQYEFSNVEENVAYLTLSVTVISIYLVVLVKNLLSIFRTLKK
ncbi:DUF3592 domain-containing protein [Clostridium sp.]|uniref:DUF3592 domain-containing protein n=1 Tax=Clostridium sp. TaxID=1506 RepID=UPI00399568E9